MAETIQKGDFIEVDFTGRIKSSDEIFDTTKKQEAEKIGSKNTNQIKPLIISVGNKMVLKGLDNDLQGKEIGKDYVVNINPEEAFGKRNPSLVKMIPLKAFLEQKIVPQRGMQFSLDGSLVRIISVSSGRVLADFNNPLAGKEIYYNYKILRKVAEEKEKIDALQEFFFRKKFESKIDKDKKEVVFLADNNYKKFIEMMSKPFEEMLGLKIKCEVVEDKTGEERDKEEKSTQ